MIELNNVFEIPKVEFSALTLNDADVVLSSGFASVGVDVAFNGNFAWLEELSKTKYSNKLS